MSLPAISLPGRSGSKESLSRTEYTLVVELNGGGVKCQTEGNSWRAE